MVGEIEEMGERPGSEPAILKDLAYSIRRGASNQAIYRYLKREYGIEREDARLLVETFRRKYRIRLADLVRPALAGGAAAFLCGTLWGVVSIYSETVKAYGGLFLGAAVGWAVLSASKGLRGAAVQAVGGIFSILGILLGEYIIIFYLFKEDLLAKGGAAAVKGISPFSRAAWDAFRDRIAGNLLRGEGAGLLVSALVIAAGLLKRRKNAVPRLRKERRRES